MEVLYDFMRNHGFFLFIFGLLVPLARFFTQSRSGEKIKRQASLFPRAIGLFLLGIVIIAVAAWRGAWLSAPVLSLFVLLLSFFVGYYGFQEPIASIDKENWIITFEGPGVRAPFSAKQCVMSIVSFVVCYFGAFLLAGPVLAEISQSTLERFLLVALLALLGGLAGYFLWLMRSFLHRE